MGKMLYSDSDIVIEFDDRALTHLQLVIGAKLRRHESFFFSWGDAKAVGSGRSSIWMDSANSGQGLVYSEEPGMPAAPPRGLV